MKQGSSSTHRVATRKRTLVHSSRTSPHEESPETQLSVAPLSTWVSLRRRYTRSVNLERDLSTVGSVRGYVLTARASDALERMLDALLTPNASRSFTLTGVYGTGKSAFAHFLASILSAADDEVRADALKVLANHPYWDARLPKLKRQLPKAGFVRAVVTARRESLAAAVVRALARGLDGYAPRGRTPTALHEVRRLAGIVARGEPIEGSQLVELIDATADATGRGILLVIDELGKILEHAAQSSGSDVYLLQQLAEKPTSGNGHPIAVLGLLHQTFSEYGGAMISRERTEWQKVQGRFEDIAFLEAPEQMLGLMQSAIEHDLPAAGERVLMESAQRWHAYFQHELSDPYVGSVLTPAAIAAVAPLHPVAALALPALCAKYAQHDRSLFSFLTSNEPHAFSRFLREQISQPTAMPLQRLASLYDYFIDVAGQGLAFRPQFQRWAEVHGVISDARSLSPDLLEALKTIGALNLLTTASGLRASRNLVLAALSTTPDDIAERLRWTDALDVLVAKRIITFRSQLDEYRVWEGSEFDVEQALREYPRSDCRSLSLLLDEFAPLGPVVAQRHSYQTGTLRYFERRYADSEQAVRDVVSRASDSDGCIVYWVGDATLVAPPRETGDGRPLVIVEAADVGSLRGRAMELAALRAIARLSILQSDGVARREVSARMKFAESDLARGVRGAFDLSRATVWVNAKKVRVGDAAFNSQLSDLCDITYRAGITVWNEQINRRDLTSAGARARRELIDAMLSHGDHQRLDISGDGPEASIYETVLRATGIHRLSESGTTWTFGPPTDPGIAPLWDAIESFCIGARGEAKSVDALLAMLDRPPYGIKRGIIPVLFAAVLLYHTDDVSVYYQGSFIPVLGPEQWELLVKQPQHFAVKHFELSGVRWQVFRQLEDIIRSGDTERTRSGLPARNSTLLGVLRPLVRFATRLPEFTVKSKTLSNAALQVRDALRSVREPDELLFRVLPEALGLDAIPADASTAAEVAPTYRRELLLILRELEGAYDRLLERCRVMLTDAFGVNGDPTRLRQELSIRGQHLLGRVIEPTLQSVVLAMVNDTASEREWLEAFIMVIADKPADVWSDDEALAFEFRVSDVARRFRNLWSLLHATDTSSHGGVDARRISLTRGNGYEDHHVVWIDAQTRASICGLVSEFMTHLSPFPREQQLAVAAAVAEAIFEAEPADIKRATGAARRPHAGSPRRQRTNEA